MFAKLLLLAVVGVLASAAPSLGAAPPIVAQGMAVGKMKATTIHATAGSMLLTSITIAPGGNFNWHEHGAPVAVVVTGGTLTVFDPAVHGCAPFRVSKGQSFVEPANHVHLARNDGKTRVTLYALYMGLPNPKAANIAETEPASCNA